MLDFFFLIFREGRIWRGRSVRTGHVSASKTPAGAVKNLALAIDAEIAMAMSDGLTVQQWYELQKPADEKYIAMFWKAIARRNPDYRKKSRGQNAVVRAVVVKAAA